MADLLRAELLKLTTVRTTWIVVGIGLLGEALFAGLFSGLASESEFANLVDITDVERGVGLLMVMLLVLGAMTITNEFRHQTASTTFLASPRRYPVMTAKLGALTIFCLFAGLVYVLLNAGLSMPLLSGRGVDLPSLHDSAEVYAGVVASYLLLAGFGLGIGAIVRNQAGAIVTALAFFFLISPLTELIPGNVDVYFPSKAVGSLHGSAEEGLSQIDGGLVLLGWVFGLCAVGTLLLIWRDVND
jgi:ABC-type transport system involved in multi-copper enzyme maturation permease subunit